LNKFLSDLRAPSGQD